MTYDCHAAHWYISSAELIGELRVALAAGEDDGEVGR